MSDRVTSLHCGESMLKIHDLGVLSKITIESENGTITLNMTRSELLEFMLDSVELIGGCKYEN